MAYPSTGAATPTTPASATLPGGSLPAVEGHLLLVGGYGAGNLGDEAILSGLLDSVPSTVETLTVVSHDPPATLRDHAPEAPATLTLRAVRPTPWRLGRALFAADAVAIGGGGIFSRYMGPYATKLPAFALGATALGRPVHWTALGVYDSTPPRVLRALALALRRAASVTVRDPASRDTLARLGVDAVRVADPALSLTPDPARGRRLLAAAGLDPDRPVLGVAARRVADPAADARLDAAYRAVVAEFVARGWQVVYLPFCRHPTVAVERDQRVCTTLASHCGGRVLAVATAPDLLAAVAACDALVATRLHSMLFAHRAGTRFVAVEYATKVRSLLAETGHADVGVPLDAVSGAALVARLDDALGTDGLDDPGAPDATTPGDRP